MNAIEEAIAAELTLSYVQAGRHVSGDNVVVVSKSLKDALGFDSVEEVRDTFRRARNMEDIPTQRVLSEALRNHRAENIPQPKVEMIEDNRPGKKIPTNEEVTYMMATHSVCGTGPKITNDCEIIAKFEADPKNAECVAYQRAWLKKNIRLYRNNN